MEPAQQRRVYGFLSLAVISLVLTLYQMRSSIGTTILPDFHKDHTEIATRGAFQSSIPRVLNNDRKIKNNCNISLAKVFPPGGDCVDSAEKRLKQTKKTMLTSTSKTDYSQYLEQRNQSNIPFDVYKLAPKIFNEVPPEFFSRYKNPCWDRGRGLYCLPYFYLIGMPKCGSSDLYMKLTSHNQIIPSKRKEPAFWNKQRFIWGSKGFNQYMDIFSDFRDRLLLRDNSSRHLITGEGTVASMWSTFDMARMDGDTGYGLPDILHAIQPDAKFFVILRDPLQRLSSDYHYFGDFKRSPSDLHQKVVMAINEFNRCKKRHKDDLYCIGVERSWSSDCIARVTLGIYSVLLRQWFKVFPASSFFIIKLDRWESDCVEVLRRAYSFLELDPLPDPELDKICSKNKALTGKRTKIPMLGKTRTILECFYKPYNDDLESFLASQLIDKRNL